MLTRENNERLVRVGPGTPMGALMRRYWLPFLFSADLEADGQPMRVRLLCEDLVAFRDSHGAIGLVDHVCPHRGAPMVFGRNEEGGLRCVYHGWRFEADGRCTDMPAEPPDSTFADKVRIKSYPCRERNGVVWAYMGPEANPPELPSLEWNLVPMSQSVCTLRIQDCNWLQALEGEIDSAHAAILHGRVDAGGVINQWKQAADLRPTFECESSENGVSIASRRVLGSGQVYWRVNQFMLPFYTLVPPFPQYPELSGHAWVPIDDENTLCLMFSYHPTDPFYEKTRAVFRDGHGGRETGHPSANAYEPAPITEPFAKYRTRYRRDNAYRFSYELQQKSWFSGLPGLWVQDAACQSGVAAIYDRSQERLGSTDTGIVQARKLLLDTLRRFETGQTLPASAHDPETFMVRAVSLTLAPEAHWKRDGGQFTRATLGQGFGYQP